MLGKARCEMLEPDLCCDCKHYGKPLRWTKHNGKEKVTVHECEIHPGCYNTMYSAKCEDFYRIRERTCYGEDKQREGQTW